VLLKDVLYLQNSANIIVQNRITGQLEEEKMQVYVRLGIRSLYKGATSRMEGGRGMIFFPGLISPVILIDLFTDRRLLKSLSIKQGIKYDAPASAQDIAPFIAFYALNVDEMLDPPDSFSMLLNVCLTTPSNKFNQKLLMSFSIGIVSINSRL
jgi:phosphatidylserine decarboxylase